MKVLLPYLRPYTKLIFLALFLAAINQIFSLLDPLILGEIIDKYANKVDDFIREDNPGGREDFLRGVLTFLALGVGAAMVSRLAKNFQDYFVNVITQKLGARIYQDGLRHALDLPYQDFEDQRSGQTLGVLQKVRQDTERLVSTAVNTVFTTLVGIVFITYYAFTVHWAVAPVYFATIPIISFLSVFMSRRIKKVQKSIVGETTSLAGATTESLRNIELLKSLGLARQEEKRLNATTDKILVLELKKVRYLRSLSFLQGTIINFLRTVILFIMLYLILGKLMSTGDLVTLLMYSFFLFFPLQELGTIINLYREAEVSLDNFKHLLERPKEVRPEHPRHFTRLETLDFEEVSFQHRSGTRKALSGVSFSVEKGETIAFVGPSGSGKTTLVKLLLGLYRPQEGQICYNGIPAHEVDLDDLRKSIGFVSQDTQLFSGTIRENLLFTRPEATEEELYNALHAAACENLMARAEDGLETVIGEGGMKLSGGEKQRLSIARALLRQPQLLVFDEATSALDSLTEEEISRTIREVSTAKSHITVLIAHRLSTIMHADRIFVLEKGEIVEYGQHEALLSQKGLYYAMWRQQIGERRKDPVTA